MSTIIYGCVDKVTNQLRYIGQTSTTLRRDTVEKALHWRLKRHRVTLDNSARSMWFRRSTTRPDIFVIEIVESGADEAEKFWIEYFSYIGCDLVNTKSGLRNVTPETRAKMSASAKARIRTPESEAARLAACRTPEARKRNSEAKLGQPSAKKGKTYGSSEKGKAVQQTLGWITDGIIATRVDKSLPIPEGWWRGRPPASEETKSNMSKAHKGQSHGRRPAERIIDVFKKQAEVNWSNPDMVAKMTRNRKGRKWITNGSESRTILPSETIPDGWRLGRIMERTRCHE